MIKYEVEKARRLQEYREFKGRVHAEALRVWASIATKKEKEKFIKMFKKELRKNHD